MRTVREALAKRTNVPGSAISWDALYLASDIIEEWSLNNLIIALRDLQKKSILVNVCFCLFDAYPFLDISFRFNLNRFYNFLPLLGSYYQILLHEKVLSHY